IFNEKVLAGLGSGIDRSGRLPEEAREKTLATLRRFKLLLDHMKVKETQVVATAAVRDAGDGADFVREVEGIGLGCRVLSAAEERSTWSEDRGARTRGSTCWRRTSRFQSLISIG